MFERFTDRARETVVLAQEEARLHNHNYIGTEHLMLALLKGGDSVAAHVLHGFGMDLDQARADVLAIVGAGTRSPSGHIPFTPRSKKVLELSLREALKVGDNHIGTEHILLGLLREGEGVAAAVLVRRAGELSVVREAVLEQMRRPSDNPIQARAFQPRDQTPAAQAALAVARGLAATGALGSHHLLEALARAPDSAAGRALAALGVDPEALSAKIDELGIEGTSDLTPIEAAARRMQLRLDHDGTTATIVLDDEASVDLVRSLIERLDGPISGADPAIRSLSGLWQAVTTELELLVGQMATGEPSSEGESGPLAPIRQAIQSRLRRRQPR